MLEITAQITALKEICCVKIFQNKEIGFIAWFYIRVIGYCQLEAYI
jgi:hypothetical protein